MENWAADRPDSAVAAAAEVAEVAEAAENPGTVTMAASCPALIAVGPGTGRRSHSSDST
ncbi:hypothetical protein SDC9_79571 [bioreactor metagenome]|uniref:Uncharacterized protein n=1 Tax=bioreactor metagenome TaxID=1076179 RepID=A0A644Z4H1_9ZZZZ